MKTAILALAGMFGMGTGAATMAQANLNSITVPHKSKDVKINTMHKVVREVGGMDLAGMGNPGMTPKEYGQRFGNGGSKRSNRLRYSHNAKLKRRMA